MRRALTGLILIILILGCNHNQGDLQPDPLTPDVQKKAAVTKLLDDNRRLDLPTFDDSNADRQFPYSPVTATKGPRLIQTKENGMVVLNYRYNSAGRLQEAYQNFTGSDVAGSRQVYLYGEQGLQQISFYWGPLPDYPISLIRTLTFMTNRVGRIDRYFESTNANGGSTQQLRFDQSGHLIWSAMVIGDPNSSTEVSGYSRAIRDVNNNVRRLRSPAGQFYTIDYDYDTKPNPFYLLSVPDFTSPNNIVRETRRDISGEVVNVTEYSYEYRADGYPIRRRSGTDVFEYVYTN